MLRHLVAAPFVLLFSLGSHAETPAEPVDMGMWLEKASAVCGQGDAKQLEIISQRILELVAQHPALQSQRDYIEKLLVLFQSGVCEPGQLLQQQEDRAGGVGQARLNKGALNTVRFSAGHMNNVNLGSRHEEVPLQFNDDIVMLQLREDELPLSSPFFALQGVRQSFRGAGTVDHLVALQQIYTDAPDFNVTAIAMGRRQRLDADKDASVYFNAAGDGRGGSRLGFGGSYRQSWSSSTGGHNAWQAELRYDKYPGDSLLDALVFDVGVEKTQGLDDGSSLLLSATAEYDLSLGQERPGGDRRGIEVALGWQDAADATWQPALKLELGYRRDAQPYSRVGFGDSVRDQLRTRLNLGAGRAMGSRSKLLLNYQYSQTRDSEIPLFDQPAGHSFSIAVETPLGN